MTVFLIFLVLLPIMAVLFDGLYELMMMKIKKAVRRERTADTAKNAVIEHIELADDRIRKAS